MTEKIRSFIAVKIPRNVTEHIGKIQEEMKKYSLKMRWASPENIHLTLKFLGDIQPGDVKPVREAMEETAAGFCRMTLTAGGVGVFPGIRRPRVVWIGLKGNTPELIGMQKKLDNRLKEIGYTPEKRGFKGHLTVGRARGNLDPKTVTELISEFSGFETEPFPVEEIVLFRSDLKPKGAVYTPLSTCVLKPE